MRQNLADSWAQPGTRLGFWMHFTSQFSATTMSLLWGYPFFVRGEGRSSATAGLLLTLIVVAVMCLRAGPRLAGRRPPVAPLHDRAEHRRCHRRGVDRRARSGPGTRRSGCCCALVVFAGLGGPASIIGFDVGRTSNPAHRLGTATGIINQGGFYASLFLVVAIGLVLDWRTPGSGSDYPASAFRWAMSVQYLLWALGLVQIWRYRLRTRALILEQQAEEAELAQVIDRH